MNTLLEAKEVTKIYGKSGHPSLNKVSFRVEIFRVECSIMACGIILLRQ